MLYTPRPGHTRHDSAFLGVADDRHHDGNRRCRLFRHEGAGVPWVTMISTL